MDREFVERRSAGFYLAASRVPPDFIVRVQQGESPEAIRSDFPTLSLEQVYGAIAFYLGHKDEEEKAMAERAREEDAYSAAHPAPPDLKGKFERLLRREPRMDFLSANRANLEGVLDPAVLAFTTEPWRRLVPAAAALLRSPGAGFRRQRGSRRDRRCS